MSALRHSQINARRASDWRTVTEAACGCYCTFDSPEDAVGMRWSSSSCRMLLQMSLNSFSTCVTRHGTGQTWKIRLRERPRRGSPRGGARRGLRGEQTLDFEAQTRSPCRWPPYPLAVVSDLYYFAAGAAPAVTAAFGGHPKCIPLRRCSARRLSQVPARVGASRTHPGLLDAF